MRFLFKCVHWYILYMLEYHLWGGEQISDSTASGRRLCKQAQVLVLSHSLSLSLLMSRRGCLGSNSPNSVPPGSCFEVLFFFTSLTNSHFFNHQPRFCFATSQIENLKIKHLSLCHVAWNMIMYVRETFSQEKIDFPLGCDCGIIHHFCILLYWDGESVGQRVAAALAAPCIFWSAIFCLKWQIVGGS